MSRPRPGIEDVARLAGVSTATVDRVLNERGSVSAKTINRVLDAARRLGLRRQLPSPYQRGVRIRVIITRPDTPYYDRIRGAVATLSGRLDRSITLEVHSVEEGAIDDLVDLLEASASRCDGVVFVPPEDRRVTEKLSELAARPFPVVAMGTQFSDAACSAVIGVDNVKVGRAAAYFMGHFAGPGGKTIFNAGDLRYAAHKDRLVGFEGGLREYHPEVELADVIDARMDEALTRRKIIEALDGNPDIRGVYNPSGLLQLVCQTVQAYRVARPVAVIGHQLGEVSIGLLKSGMASLIIDENLESQVEKSVLHLLHILRSPGEVQPDTSVSFAIYTRDCI